MTGPPPKSRYPVVIVGGGTVGLSLAAELGWRGIDCLMIEQRAGVNPHPRSNAVANRTMEYYRRWGIDEAISNAGIPPSLPAEYLWVTSLHGREVHRVSLPPYDDLAANRTHRGGYESDEHSWSPYLKTITGQNEVEAVLLDYVLSLPTVDVRVGWQLTEFADEGDQVVVRIEDLDSGEVHEVAGDYLAACDGGRSTVRRGLGVSYEGAPGMASFVSIYFRAPELIDRHPFGHGNIFFPLHRDHAGFLLTWDDDRTYTYHLILNDGQDWESVDPVAAVSALAGSGADELDIDVLSVQPWTAHELVVSEYVRGRIALAGDAAHLFSPTGGFGMNTGVSDVIDLAWKLEAGLAGWAGPRLLGSYDRERRPIGVRNTREGADCFERLYGVMQNGDELDRDDLESVEVRAALAADIKDQEKLITSSGTLLGYRYEGSDIIVPDGTPEPPDDPRRYRPVARPGHRAPHVWLADESALADRFGKGFTLLVLGPEPSADIDDAVAAFEAYAADLGMPLAVVRIDEPMVHEVYETELALIRPDLMVAWRHRGEAVDAVTILDTVRGA